MWTPEDDKKEPRSGSRKETKREGGARIALFISTDLKTFNLPQKVLAPRLIAQLLKSDDRMCNL